MERWVRVCSLAEAPGEGMAIEADAEGTAVCLARVGGVLAAVDNWCPHRRGPLGQGWIEGGSVVCPWHSWTFDLTTGEAEYPVHERVAVFPVRVAGEDVLVQLDAGGGNQAGNVAPEVGGRS
ncbi:MAG: Rieske 2Fe-2S domain-containing protein [Acidobacteriota bacterium]|nr:Rieske 2Fe-2S domain-containing protein [Acidobacteriota bacterium]